MGKVFVSGCFDVLHSGHIAFFESAAKYGDLYVSIGSDKTINELKKREPVMNEKERQYIVGSLKYVKECLIGSGSGVLDFSNELAKVMPDIFIVNQDGDNLEKRKLCDSLGIKYLVLKREPKEGMPKRSTTALRGRDVPYRIDLAGGWLDQPFVSKLYPGPVIVFSIFPTHEFDNRSGMATSTRKKALRLWHKGFPKKDFMKWAEVLFAFDNPPGTGIISGSQDAYGIMLPGLNKLNYNGEYLPSSVESLSNEHSLWLESKIKLISLGSRKDDYDVLSSINLSKENVLDLSEAAESTWRAIKEKDITKLGESVRKSFESQIKMFPNMVNAEIMETISRYKDKAYGWKLSGAGGGGYIILITDQKIPGAKDIKIRVG